MNEYFLIHNVRTELFCIYFNITYDEYITLNRKVYLKNPNGQFENPFNKGLIQNIKEFLHISGINWDKTIYHTIFEITEFKYKKDILDAMNKERDLEEQRVFFINIKQKNWIRPKIVSCPKCQTQVSIPNEDNIFYTCPYCSQPLILTNLKDVSNEISNQPIINNNQIN